MVSMNTVDKTNPATSADNI